MTRDEFEQAYAARSDLTVEQLHELTLHGYPCDCGDDICEGWKMLSDESRASEVRFEEWKGMQRSGSVAKE